MGKGNVYDINGFKYIAMDEKVENHNSLLLLVNISQIANPSLGKWIAEVLLPQPLSKIRDFDKKTAGLCINR